MVHFGPFWPEEVHFGPFRSANRTLAIPDKRVFLGGVSGFWLGFWGSTPRLSGPLDRLNAILSLLHPLDRYRSPSAIGTAIGRPLSRPIPHPNTVVGVLNRLILNRLGGSTAR